MFSSLKFRDVFTELGVGTVGVPGLFAAGSSVGSAISMIGVRKVVFHLFAGSGAAGSAQLLVVAASVSAGTGSKALGSLGVASNSLLTSALSGSLTSASGGVAVVEVRGEFLENNTVGPWIFPVLSVSGGSINAIVTAHGFLRNYEPASNYDTANFVISECDLF